MEIELLQFRYSPYNEKARWALDLKRLPHRRRSLLPGPHLRTLRKLTGQTATPVLRIGPRYVAGSAAILAALEDLAPEPRLFPADPAARAEALALERRFDEAFGPRIRCAVLAAMIGDTGFLARTFAQGQPAAKRALYRAVLPVAKSLIAKANGLTVPGAVAAGDAATRDALDLVANQAAATGYLVGGEFTLADLVAASFLAVAVDPPNSPMSRPEPYSDGFRAWRARWQDHPGADWVRRIYARHRAATADFEGPSAYA